MAIPSLSITVRHEGRPVAGLLVNVEVKVSRKNHYRVLAGPTNEDGHALLAASDILSSAKADVDFAPMDYDPIEAVFTGEFSGDVMTEERIAKALHAYDEFKDVYAYAPGYAARLQFAVARISHLSGMAFQVQVKPVR